MDDRRYFELHRQATSRVRMPFRDELETLLAKVEVPPDHAALIVVTVRRNGGSVIRARGVVFVPAGLAMSQ